MNAKMNNETTSYVNSKMNSIDFQVMPPECKIMPRQLIAQ